MNILHKAINHCRLNPVQDIPYTLHLSDDTAAIPCFTQPPKGSI